MKGKALEKEVCNAGLESHVLLTGGLAPGDPRLLGLFQLAIALLLPSLSETFGLVITEAWAAGKPVISTRTSGACSLIKERQNGWFFELNDPSSFHRAVDELFANPPMGSDLGRAGQQLAMAEYDADRLAVRIKDLYEQLIQAKNALRRPPR